MGNKSKDADNGRPLRPPQAQDRQPGREHEMRPAPEYENQSLRGSGRLQGAAALVTGGDSGIGRAIAVAFAREGADVAIIYLNEEKDAWETSRLIHEKGRRCLLHRADIGKKEECERAVKAAADAFGRLDILVNNAAEQHRRDSIADISEEQLERTFRTNLFSMFFLTAAALPHLEASDHPSIINTTSVTAYRGSPKLLD
jgi:NAD(P)-dependent dehydrogenase (short-subunit alcohol dehydrogenase family)